MEDKYKQFTRVQGYICFIFTISISCLNFELFWMKFENSETLRFCVPSNFNLYELV